MPTNSVIRFVIPAPESVWPTSIGGWVGLVAGSTALILLAVDRLTARGRNLAVISQKIDNLCSQIGDMEGRLGVVDGLVESVRELTQEWRGIPNSDNGYRSIIRENQRRLAAIEKRNDRLDAIRQVRDEDEKRSGGQHRRAMDRETNNLIPEEREEKG